MVEKNEEEILLAEFKHKTIDNFESFPSHLSAAFSTKGAWIFSLYFVRKVALHFCFPPHQWKAVYFHQPKCL